MLAPAELARTLARHDAPWNTDPALLPLLQAILDDAAPAARGARLVLRYGDNGQFGLTSPSGLRAPWRAAAAAIIDQEAVVSHPGVVGAPVLGAGIRGVVLLYHHPATELAAGETLARAFAKRVEMELAASTARLSSITGIVDGLVHMLAAYDPATAVHSQVVRRLARACGQAARLSSSQLLELEWAAALHDVGKVSIPLPVLHKVGSLSAPEWALIRQHPTIGERIVRPVPGLEAVAFAIRHHHERWDGAGYPDRLAGTAIPLASRLVAVVDAYETMRAGRPYRAPFSRDEAIRELESGAGRQFDPALLDLLPALRKCDIDF